MIQLYLADVLTSRSVEKRYLNLGYSDWRINTKRRGTTNAREKLIVRDLEKFYDTVIGICICFSTVLQDAALTSLYASMQKRICWSEVTKRYCT